MFRNTPTKEAIVKAMQESHQPQTLSEIHQQVKKVCPSIAFSTIFRTVKQLETQQKVDRVNWRDRNTQYEWQETHHHHLVCEKCGVIKVLEDKSIGFKSENLTKTTGFVVKNHQIEVMGLCPKCQ